MDQRISFVTLAAADLVASRAFYCDGLGWTAALEVPGDVVMIEVGEHVVLSLWDRAAFEAEVGPIATGAGVPPFTLAHNVATRAEVDTVLATARAAGADPVGVAEERAWGGYTGYFADPDGYRWEVAYNPGPLGRKGAAVSDPRDPSEPGAQGGPHPGAQAHGESTAEPTTEAMNAAGDREDRDDRTVLTGHDVEAELLADWRVMFDQLHARFATGDFATGLRLVAAIGEAAEAMDHHPDVELTYAGVVVRLSSHDVGGVTARDVRLAREVSDAAGRLGATPEPHRLSVLELALDTPDLEAVRPFWAALLGYEGTDEVPDELRDPSGHGPTLWFQESGPRSPQDVEQRFHLDLRVPPEVAESRVRAAVEAGGTLVTDGYAPRFWVLADAQGNQACITTWLGRES
ncbi:VOC family protein [Nocardioides sp. SOB77]|uniref:Putative pterin-4-alpha-carbinolamine dehydratase n=1 Tax=Nocardioides oceani TaxID=3058369 RepID=A0ABT8FDT0_9ACTN|nr:VOC family protein [Nocardioides oceani]MDN4172754.1 VOC family protein [Nocardioides oceani]